MRQCAAALALVLALTGSARAGCGEWVRLAVEPAEKADEVAAVLRRRLEAAGAKPPIAVERDGFGVKARLPENLGEPLLTEPGKFEMRLLSNSADAAKMPRLDGGPAEAVEPQIILDEFHLRDLKLVDHPEAADPRFALALAFHIDPVGMRNLAAATADAVGRKLAVIVDDSVLVTPVIRGAVAAGSGEVSGGLTRANTAYLPEALRGGRLPARVNVVGRETAVCVTP